MQQNNQSTKAPVRTVLVGCGGMARHHIRNILKQPERTTIPVVCEPSADAYEAMCEVFEDAGITPPANEPSLEKLLQSRAGELDAAFIITPHAYHHEQAKACLESGVDVLLEKPMVMNANEAKSLMATRDKTGKLLVVSFNGSLSPNVRTAVQVLRSGELGPILTLSAVVWQNWNINTKGKWRQIPEIAGGGFLFDTGAHMLNTTADLAGEDFVEVAAWLDNRDAPVDINGTVMGRLASGAMVSLAGCGDMHLNCCHSDVRVFCRDGIVRTGVWGERLEIRRPGDPDLMPIETKPSMGQWDQFLLVRAGEIPNPCPPEVGLRMAKLWDMIQASAAQGGKPVTAAM
ncbi:MAG: Gfo/Idh/MocA family oxidoreductase [Caldilineaceae bacterium]